MITWIVAILTFILTALGAYGLHSLDISRVQKADQSILAAQVAQLNATCARQEQQSSEVDSELQKQDNLTAGSYDAAISLLNTPSVSSTNPSTSAAISVSAPSDRRLYYVGTAAAIAALKRAEIATEQAHQLIACQQLLTDERKPSP